MKQGMKAGMKVVVVGCGIVGAAIAYELSQIPDYTITVLDQQAPAQASTGAALGVLMGAISQKVQGRNLRLRLAGIQRYNEWIPQLEAQTGRSIRFNRQGILRLCFAGEDLARWDSLAQKRQVQGWPLVLCDRADLAKDYPHLNLQRVIGAVYSPCDRQVDPTALTLALVEAAQQNGVTFAFGSPMLSAAVQPSSASTAQQVCHHICTPAAQLETDWLIIAAGLGSTPLTTALHQPIDLRPVLGQALQVQLPEPLGKADQQPVITGEDVHIVPLGGACYWIGATVEFAAGEAPVADAARLEQVRQQAIAFCPSLQQATIQRQWAGLRPRPEGRPAPIVELLPGYANVMVASGHYRNGVLLAPATAAMVKAAIAGLPIDAAVADLPAPA